MRITIEIPDDLLSRGAPTLPTMTTDVSANGGMLEATSGGEAAGALGGVALSQHGFLSAGVAEQGGEVAEIVSVGSTNDGGAAPKYVSAELNGRPSIGTVCKAARPSASRSRVFPLGVVPIRVGCGWRAAERPG